MVVADAGIVQLAAMMNLLRSAGMTLIGLIWQLRTYCNHRH
jgi:hypothetical protein